MAKKVSSSISPPIESDKVRDAARALIAAVKKEAAERALSPKGYDKAIRDLERLRGRPLFYPMLMGGQGSGARLQLADGTKKLDFIGAVGAYAFGHSDEDLLLHAVIAAAGDVVHQGHLLPGAEYLQLSKALLRHAGSELKHVWLSMSGAMANENALKMIFQKKTPADHVIVFDGAFHGRTLALSELSDRPAFREGLPKHGNVLNIPFYDAHDPDSTVKSLAALETHLKRHPGRIATLCFELVQGEGGFDTAPREFFAALMARCQDAGVAVWIDEVQTFARTGELFAFRTLGLDEYVDVVTAGKILQGSATLVRKSFNPNPGLIAGTFAGNTVGMTVGARIIERLEEEGYLGPEGRTALLGRRIDRRFESLKKHMPKAIGERSGMGAMQAFVPWHGSADIANAVLHACFEEGLILLSAGSNPVKVRMLPPVNTTDEELECAFNVLEKALRRVAEDRKLPC